MRSALPSSVLPPELVSSKDAGHLEQRLSREISKLKEETRYRSLSRVSGIDFTSNDYLGLANNESIRKQLAEYVVTNVPLSASGSRLLRGNHPEHEALEQRFANFLGCEATLFFNSGYDANFALLTTLPTRHDTILLDSLVHASLKEGAHSSQAEKRIFEHNSIKSLREATKRIDRKGDIYVVVESVYSMDGDEAPLTEIAAFCREQKLILVIDEAHGTGVFGTHGRGLIDELGLRPQTTISVHTCGKALGVAGAVIACSPLIKEYLINRARPFIYTTALPPLIPQQIMSVLDLLESQNDLFLTLYSNVALVRTTLTTNLRRWRLIPGRSPIVAVIIGEDAEAVKAALYLQEHGFDVRAIRPPTVPARTARLRIAIHADHTEAELQQLCDALIATEAECEA